jgi:predicted nucleotidyltransferase
MMAREMRTSTFHPISKKTLDEIVERLVSLASPVKIILFGSYARNRALPGSDLDLLVVEKEVSDQYDEALRLDRALGDLMLPLDLIVVSEAQFTRYGRVPGTVYYRSLQEGRILYAQS